LAKGKKRQQDEHVLLLRGILAELRRLNANLEKRGMVAPVPAQEIEDAEDPDSEELEYFE
jgi:hypothetical protein